MLGRIQILTKGVLDCEGLYSGEATVTAAKQLWGVGVGGGYAVWKLKQLRYSMTQETSVRCKECVTDYS